MKAQFIYGFCKICIRKNNTKMTFIWPSNPRRPPFLYIYCYYNYTAKHANDDVIYLL